MGTATAADRGRRPVAARAARAHGTATTRGSGTMRGSGTVTKDGTSAMAVMTAKAGAHRDTRTGPRSPGGSVAAKAGGTTTGGRGRTGGRRTTARRAETG